MLAIHCDVHTHRTNMTSFEILNPYSPHTSHLRVLPSSCFGNYFYLHSLLDNNHVNGDGIFFIHKTVTAEKGMSVMSPQSDPDTVIKQDTINFDHYYLDH